MDAGPLRVALFTGAYNHIRDGVALTLNRLTAYLERHGMEVRVFAPTARHPAMRHAGTLIAVPSLPAPGRPDYRLSLALPRRARRALAEWRPHVVHIATPDLLGVQALRLARRWGVPAVSSYHTHFASYLDYYHLERLEGAVWRYLRWFYGQCRELYVPSAAVADVLRQHGIGGRIIAWPRGVDTALFHPRHRSVEWRRSVGAGGGEPIITFVSRLVPEKGIGVLAEVLHGLTQGAVAHRAVIVGDGPARAELAGRLPHTHFTGTLAGEALARAYASSDLFLFPSDTETFGSVTLEAMASGVPVVCADALGSRSLVRDGVTGLLAPAGRSERFLDHVMRLLGDEALRARMGAAARQHALAYDWERVLARMARSYHALAAGRAAP